MSVKDSLEMFSPRIEMPLTHTSFPDFCVAKIGRWSVKLPDDREACGARGLPARKQRRASGNRERAHRQEGAPKDEQPGSFKAGKSGARKELRQPSADLPAPASDDPGAGFAARAAESCEPRQPGSERHCAGFHHSNDRTHPRLKGDSRGSVTSYRASARR